MTESAERTSPGAPETVDADRHRLSMTILMTPDMSNFAGNVHGGILLSTWTRSPTPAPPAGRAATRSRSSSTSLGRRPGAGVDALSADGAGASPGREQCLQLAEHGIETQAGAATFGLVRSRVTNSWAAVTRVTWRCQPAKVRPSKWSRPSAVLHSR